LYIQRVYVIRNNIEAPDEQKYGCGDAHSKGAWKMRRNSQYDSVKHGNWKEGHMNNLETASKIYWSG